MTKMYLVRRENTRFIGPMNRTQFREGLRKMEFGLQDEVSGHCGSWVIIDRQESMNRYYPELAAIVSEELPVAWREMTGHAKKMTQNEKRAKPNKNKTSSRPGSKPSSQHRSQALKKRNQRIFLSSVLVAALALAVGFWIKVQDEQQVPSLGEIPQLSLLPDPNGFLNEMGLKMLPVVAKVNKNKDVQNAWLPFLRMYAFYTSGSIDGVPLKLLKGSVGPTAPQDCSVETWKKKWLEVSPQIPTFVSGKTMSKNAWAKILAWDPYWIKRRPVKGWIKPKNWYDGCLMSASVAMRSISETLVANDTNGLTPEVIAIVVRRLQTQLEILREMKPTNTVVAGSFLDGLSCLDLSSDYASLKSCKQKFTDASFDQMFEENYFWQLVRMVLEKPSISADRELQVELTGLANKFSSEESFSKLDYSAELNIVKDLVQNGFKFEGVHAKMQTEFADGKIKP